MVLNRRWQTLAIALLAGLSRPAASHEPVAITTSGMPEAIFDLSPAETLARMEQLCRDREFAISSKSKGQLICEIRSVALQSMIDDVIDNKKKRDRLSGFVVFSAKQQEGSTKVDVGAWLERRNAGVRTYLSPLNSAVFQNDIVYHLVRAGGRLPPNTAFPNHAYLGVYGEPIVWGDVQALRVERLSANSPAGAAGIEPGDIIYRIAGLTWLDFNGYLDAMAKATETPTYAVDANRSGEELTFTVDRVFRGPES